VSRLESVEAFASIKADDWPKVVVEACRLAVSASGIDDQVAVTAVRALQPDGLDLDSAASLRDLAERLDEGAWDAQEGEEQGRYDLLFRRSRAASALAYALSGQPDEAIYEASYAVGTPDELVRLLSSYRDRRLREYPE
jgi:hypothetical protein